MELFLNELSITPLSESVDAAKEKMQHFVKAWGYARRNAIRTIRSDVYEYQIQLCDDYSLADWLNDKTVSPDLRSLMFGAIIPPFIHDGDKQYEDFVFNDYTFNDAEHNSHNSIGLAAAYLHESISISFNSHPQWCVDTLQLTIGENKTHRVVDVLNLYGDSPQTAKIIAFFDALKKIEIIATELAAADKKVTLFGDHHGKKFLKPLADKIKNCEYVEEIRSTAYGGNKFVRKINSDGSLEITCMESDERFALWVKTTGRNFHETELIAKILTETFS